MVSKICEVCGVEYQFESPTGSDDRVSQVCSDSCRGKWYRFREYKKLIEQAIEMNDFTVVKKFPLERFVILGFKVKIESDEESKV
jgi:hypothetical protein